MRVHKKMLSVVVSKMIFFREEMIAQADKRHAQ